MPKPPAITPLAALLFACGELFPDAPPAGDIFDSPLEGLPPELLALFAQGDANFERVFTVEEGLGPLFNNVSCESCHPADGRATPDEMLVRFSRAGDPAHAEGGPQLQSRAIPGFRPEVLPDGVETSPRLPPPVFGMGLIEAIPAETILALEDPDDLDGDGISGRANLVTAADYATYEYGAGAGAQLGRYGRKAGVGTLLEQVATAYQQDIGITSDYLFDEPGHLQAGERVLGDGIADPELSSSEVLQTAAYVRLLAPPARGRATASTQRGEAVFADVGCAACHLPSLRTGQHPIQPLSGVDVQLYSDLLLHDMGPGLADGRPEGLASGTEWRTTPLWGLRLAGEFLGGTAFYLHDGRTSDLAEAIEWHGGEAQGARDAFVALPDADRQALLAFLRSL